MVVVLRGSTIVVADSRYQTPASSTLHYFTYININSITGRRNTFNSFFLIMQGIISVFDIIFVMKSDILHTALCQMTILL